MRVLFTAPLDFDRRVWDEYRETFDIVEHGDCDAWVCNPTTDFVIGYENMVGRPNLKIIATPSTGRNHIDLAACERLGVKVLSLLDDRENLDKISASAEFTFKLILDVLRLGTPRELQGRTVGLVGYGRIGKRLAKWCRAFEAVTAFHDPAVKGSMPLWSLFEISDVVVICCALNDETRGMITGQLIESMKPQARLVNTARGEVLNEPDVKAALAKRADIRVALDVLTGETTGTADAGWWTERGHIVTPHIAGATFDSRTKAARIILGLLKKEAERELA